jgi:hypothetical protein
MLKKLKFQARNILISKLSNSNFGANLGTISSTVLASVVLLQNMPVPYGVAQCMLGKGTNLLPQHVVM